MVIVSTAGAWPKQVYCSRAPSHTLWFSQVSALSWVKHLFSALNCHDYELMIFDQRTIMSFFILFMPSQKLNLKRKYMYIYIYNILYSHTFLILSILTFKHIAKQFLHRCISYCPPKEYFLDLFRNNEFQWRHHQE